MVFHWFGLAINGLFIYTLRLEDHDHINSPIEVNRAVRRGKMSFRRKLRCMHSSKHMFKFK